ncbi:uncharacterized protein LOC141671548 [Apium graveolens]|uniref:uncharacterized protein LOC141671548 n=1 Tax=Apium graveolens TaxID=4045 RepID=UPI003D7AA031
MVDAIVSLAIEKLGAIIAQEVNILLEVKDNLRWLKDELRYLQSSIRSAESRQEEEQIRIWVEDIRDVANDAIKILSDFSAHQQEYAAPKQGIWDRVRACFCLIKKEATLYDIGKEIDSIKKRIEVIKNRRNEYRIDNILATPNKQQKERTLLRITAINNQVEVVGFEDDFKTLMGELNSEDLSSKSFQFTEWGAWVWDQIKIKIIITTRNKKVAEMADGKCFVHQLRFLTEDESWELFCKRAEPTTPYLKKLGREMAGKCRGLPLAIVILSGLLLHNRTNDFWLKVKQHMWRYLKDVGSFQIEEILSLSYNDLYPQMRDCFLYLARYPEDYVISSKELKLL